MLDYLKFIAGSLISIAGFWVGDRLITLAGAGIILSAGVQIRFDRKPSKKRT